MEERQNSTGNEQENRVRGGRSRAAQQNNFGIEPDTLQSPRGRQSTGPTYTTIRNSGHGTTKIDTTAGNSHTYNGSKHNELNHPRIGGSVTFGNTTNYYIQKHEGLEKIGTLACQPTDYKEGPSEITEPVLPPERPSTNEDSFNEFQLPPELPFPRNQNFCGREDLIDRIHSIFHPTKSEADMTAPTSTARLLIALHGLGGIGKTQIALEYAHRYEKLYSAILWVDAKDRTVLESSGVRILQQLVFHYATRSPANPDYARIANELGIPGAIDLSGTIKQDAVNSNLVWRGFKQWLQKKGNVKWLLLVDNHDDLEAVNPFDYLPTANWGRIIVTSRRSEIQSLGYSLRVEEVEKDVGRAMLSKGIPDDGVELSATEIKDADEVVEKLGGLPLAISQAAAYIAMTQIDCKTYLRKLEANFKRIASTRPSVSTYGNDSVFTCWEISFAALCPSAAQLLHLCAFLSNEDIPDVLFHRGRTGVEWLNNDEDAFDIAIENLLAYSLVKRKATSLAKCDSFWIHPIVHQWAREHLDTNDQRANAGNAISMVTTAVVTESINRDQEYWEFERRISNHLDLCFHNISKFYQSSENEYPANILLAVHRLGMIDYFRGRYDHSALCLQRALNGIETDRGKQHPSTLITVHCLAGVFDKQGDYAKALELYQRALDGCEKALGKQHPETLATVNNLAGVFEKQGEYAKALELYQRALDGSEKALGTHHLPTISSANRLARLSALLG